MYWAATPSGLRIPATPDMEALCPLCGGVVTSKCGPIKLWHWAHTTSRDCDPWGSEESVWHREWKALFPEDKQEVVLGNHRADVATASTVIEFQHSHISEQDVLERTLFYRKHRRLVRWVVDARRKDVYTSGLSDQDDHRYAHFNLPRTQPQWAAASKAGAVVLFDLSVGLFVGLGYHEANNEWSGIWGTKEYFVSSSINNPP